MDYDASDPQSIADYASGLIKKSLSDVVDEANTENTKHKGNLGDLVERLYFKIKPDNSSGLPDFPEAMLELKTTGVKQLKSGALRVKERLVLSMINFSAIVEETWGESTLMKKCRLMLILFYRYEAGVPAIDRVFLAKRLWRFPAEDLERIKADWEVIQGKVKQGKAHELSEGDTWYLGACTKSRDSSARTSQPFSDILAKPRAFSLKTKYLQTILDSTDADKNFFELSEQGDIEEVMMRKLRPFIGRTFKNLHAELIPDVNKRAKNAKARLAAKMLGYEGKTLPEFEKADIKVKTVVLGKTAVSAKEHMSFPAFNYKEIVKQDWEDSVFFNALEKRFFFMVFRVTDNGDVFLGGKFWTMPYEAKIEAERVWRETVKRIIDGRYDELPGITESEVAHVRPHGKDSNDTQLAADGNEYVKKSLWLNSRYIRNQVVELIDD